VILLDITTTINAISNSIFKKELVLDRNVYNKPDDRKELQSYAQMLQNLIFYEPNTFPNQPSMGIGIENYEFEFLDDETLTQLESKINSQAEQFLPSVYNINIKVSTVDVNNNSNKVILIRGFISNTMDVSSTDEIVLLIGKNTTTKKLVSKIMI